MEKAKRKRKSYEGQQVEFTTPFSLEETAERLYSLANQQLVLGSPMFHLRGYNGKLNVEDAVIDADTLEYRLWITPFTLDMRIVGFMKRLSETETIVVGELHIGILSYATQLILVLFAIFVLTRSPLPQSAIFLAWLGFLAWFFWRMTRRYANKLALHFENTLIGNDRASKKFVTIKRKND